MTIGCPQIQTVSPAAASSILGRQPGSAAALAVNSGVRSGRCSPVCLSDDHSGAGHGLDDRQLSSLLPTAVPEFSFPGGGGGSDRNA